MDPNAKYEIMNTKYTPSYKGNRHSRYPLKNTQYPKLQNINYEDMLKDYQKNGVYVDFPGVAGYNWSSAASASIIVFGTMLSVISGGAIPGAFLISIGTLLPVFWDLAGMGPIDRKWQDLISQGDSITIDQNVTPALLTIVNGRLQGLYELLAFFNQTYEYWKDHKGDRNAIDEVVDSFRYTNQAFIESMPSFSLGGYDIITLSLYTNAALLHLTLLRQGVLNADAWGLSRVDGELYRNLLKTRINQYINHCQTTYQSGLKKLKDNKSTNAWFLFSDYRREYTISVLNIVATFSYFNLDQYASKYTMKTQITEKIHIPSRSDFTWILPPEVADTDKKLIPELDLLKVLTQIQHYTTTLPSYIPEYKMLGKIVNHYTYTGGAVANSLVANGLVNSTTKLDGTALVSKFSMISKCIYRHMLDPGSYPVYGINKLQFDYTGQSGPPFIYESGGAPTNTAQFTVPPPQPPRPPSSPPSVEVAAQYVLSDFTTCAPVNNKEDLLYNYSWVLENVYSDNNVIQGGNYITQIPAVKGNTLENGATVREGPGHTGGSLVELGPHISINPPRVEIKCQVATEAADKILYMRIRYASDSTMSTNLNFIIGGEVRNNVACPGTDADLKKIDIPYNKFNTIEFAINPKRFGSMDVSIAKASNINGIFLIDKIEFYIKS
ncbi:insecticidal delta-endotoxin Cry8Ea1 family protein [Bacillus thuringiensis]|uniref:insecticidal delta-endotoxin Cry8Ea1 family protein n=1 Tax=Bacillus thuringiensis TaxID=1428 RepID=UPI003D0FF4C9|nr:insecticidal toxin protein [Bacillus thuringiensis]